MNETKLQKLRDRLSKRLQEKRRANARCQTCGALVTPLQTWSLDRPPCDGCIALAERLYPGEVQLIQFGPLSDKQADVDGGLSIEHQHEDRH